MKQKMKKLFLLLVSGVLPLVSSAQLTLNNPYNLPRQDDRLIKRQVSYKAPGDSGASILWDFSELQITDEHYELRYDTLHKASWVGREHHTMYYYRLRNDTFLLCGYENPTTLFTYRRPEVRLAFPFPYGRGISSYFEGTGQYCYSLNIQIAGKSTVTGDATGGMILPGGDTLRHVLRVHTRKLLFERTSPVGGQGKQEDTPFPVMDSDSIDYYLANDSSVSQIDTWTWYAEGYRYPIFETVESISPVRGENSQRFSGSFYYPPDEQYYGLEYDVENQAIRDGMELKYSNNYQGDAVPRRDNGFEDEQIDYRYSTDGQGNLRITYRVHGSACLSFSLYDLQGRQYSAIKRQVTRGQDYQECIPLQDYPEGEYLLRIVCGNKAYGEKILKQ